MTKVHFFCACVTLALAEDYVLKQGSELFKTVFNSFGRYDAQQAGVPTFLKRFPSPKEGSDSCANARNVRSNDGAEPSYCRSNAKCHHP